MTPFERLKPSIFATESGGDYNALYNYANRAGNPFAGFNLTGMTVDEALEFASPSGPYAQYVKGQVGRVATPMGAYQVVGSTLAEAKKGLELTGGEMMTEDLQDKIGQWIYKTQGPSAWEGLKGKDMATPMDRAREEELRMQMLASGTAPQAAPRAPLSALRQDRPQAAAAPQQRRSGFGGIMDYLGTPSPTTGLSRAEQFAAALDPLILPELRAGEAIRARGTQRQAETRKNKTVEYLRRMGYDDYADAVENGSIGAKDIMNALVSKSLETPTKVSAAEDKIRRLMETGLNRATAIAIADGRLTTSQDPITGQVQLIDKGTGKVIAPSVPQSVAAEAEAVDVAPAGQFEGLDPSEALGLGGWTKNVINVVGDAIGAGQAYKEAGAVSSALENLQGRTILLAGLDVAGKPSNFTREEIRDRFTISANELTTGSDRAYQKSQEMVRLLEETYAVYQRNAQGGGGASVQQQKAAMEALPSLKALLRDYKSLQNAFAAKINPASSPAVDPVEIDLMNSLLQQDGLG